MHDTYTDFPDETFVVICFKDREGRQLPPYVLATRQVFQTRAEATRYARTVSPSRRPIVVAGRFHQLRLPERE